MNEPTAEQEMEHTTSHTPQASPSDWPYVIRLSTTFLIVVIASLAASVWL